MSLSLPKIWNNRACIMGVLNVTPDSFFDKGRFFDKAKALRHALSMASDGADIIDVGGESTRPGAAKVSVEEELKRVIPVIRLLAKETDKPVSIDTRSSEVAESALKAGAKIINDVSALNSDPEMAEVAARYDAFLILMHMRGTPQDMQLNPQYKDIIKEISAYLKRSIKIAAGAGVKKNKIIIDPGIGFGKTVAHNLEILNRLSEFKRLAFPVCIGTSRKSFIGKILDSKDPEERLSGTLATCAVAIMKGANILRVHDVRETAEVALVTESILKGIKR